MQLTKRASFIKYRKALCLWMSLFVLSSGCTVYQALPDNITDSNNSIDKVYEDITSREITSESTSMDTSNQQSPTVEANSSVPVISEIKENEESHSSDNEQSEKVQFEGEEQIKDSNSIKQTQSVQDETVNNVKSEVIVNQEVEGKKQEQNSNVSNQEKVTQQSFIATDDLFDNDPFAEKKNDTDSKPAEVKQSQATIQKQQKPSTSQQAVKKKPANSISNATQPKPKNTNRKRAGMTSSSVADLTSDFWNDAADLGNISAEDLLVPKDDKLLKKALGSSTQSIHHTPLVEDPESKAFFVDKDTMEANYYDENIIYYPSKKSSLEALDELGILQDKRIKSLASLQLDSAFTSNALLLSKQEVYKKYLALKNTDNINIKYDNSKNVIYLGLSGMKLNSRINLSTVIGEIKKLDTYGTSSSKVFSDYKVFNGGVKSNLQLTVSEGYNGYIQVIADSIPYVIMVNPVEEPVLSQSMQNKYKALVSPEAKKVSNPLYGHFEFKDISFSGLDISTIESKINSILSGTYSNLDTNLTGSDSLGDASAVDTDLDNTDFSNYPTDETRDSQDAGSSYLPQDSSNVVIEGSEWGKPADGMQDNVLEDYEVNVHDGMVLDVVAPEGDSVDLTTQTSEMKPADIKGATPISVVTEQPDEKLPFTVYISLVMAIISIIVYLYYLNLFIEEYRKELETQSLIGGIDTVQIVDYSRVES